MARACAWPGSWKDRNDASGCRGPSRMASTTLRAVVSIVRLVIAHARSIVRRFTRSSSSARTCGLSRFSAALSGFASRFASRASFHASLAMPTTLPTAVAPSL